MKITCLQNELKRGLATVSHAVAGKTSFPILGNVLLSTDDGRLKIAATNLDIGITTWIGAQVLEEGAITLPAKLLNDVVGGLPNSLITLTLDTRTQTVKIECSRFTSNIKGIKADEFPTIPTVISDNMVVEIASPVLCEAIDQVAFAAAADDSRPVLAGVLVRLRGNRFSLAAADGFRLATRVVHLPEPVAEDKEWILPARAMIEVSRIAANSEGTVSLSISPKGSQVIFHTETTELVVRIIDGKFPDFERIIPAQYLTRSILNTAELLKAVKLASYFAVSSQNVVKLTLEAGEGGRLVISANAAEVGDNTGEVSGLVEGKGGQIALNVKYLADALAAIKTEQVALETQSEQSPGVFKPVGMDGYIHIIMPMNIR